MGLKQPCQNNLDCCNGSTCSCDGGSGTIGANGGERISCLPVLVDGKSEQICCIGMDDVCSGASDDSCCPGFKCTAQVNVYGNVDGYRCK